MVSFFFVVKRLVDSNHKAQYMNFPARNTSCGKLIDSYLTKKEHFTDEAIHLLFSMDRWEAKARMEGLLNEGVTLIVDRYSYSGVAFSAAKGLDLEWCKAPEKGLLKPDLVMLLTLTPDAMTRRGKFGDERYEVPELQKKVSSIYEKLKEDDFWKVIDADKTESVLNDELYKIVMDTIESSSKMPLKTLW